MEIMMKRLVRYFYAANAAALFSAAALLLVPFCRIDARGMERIFANAVAVCFWLGLILSQLFFWLCNAKRKALEKEKGRKKQKNRGIGLLVFMSSRAAAVIDVIFLLSVIAFVWVLAGGVENKYIALSVLSVLFLSFQLHCYWNGRNYKYIQRHKGEKKNEKV